MRYWLFAIVFFSFFYSEAFCQSWDIRLRKALNLDKPLCQNKMIVFERWIDELDSPVDTIFIDSSPQDFSLAIDIIDSLPLNNLDDKQLIAKLDQILDEYSARYLVQYAYRVDDYTNQFGIVEPNLFMYHYYPVEKRKSRRLYRPNSYDILKNIEGKLVLISVLLDSNDNFLEYIFDSERSRSIPHRKSSCFKNDKFIGVTPFLDYFQLVKWHSPNPS